MAQQRCWVHKTANILLNKMPKVFKDKAKQLLQAPTQARPASGRRRANDALDGLLRHVGQHGISATKGNQRGLKKIPS